MFKKLLVLCLSAFVLAGCASKGIDVSHFGGQEAVNVAYSQTDTPLLIANYGSTRPNSAGGVNFNVEFLNTSDRTIKYITFWATPYNRVDDRMVDRISKQSTKRADYTGPIEPLGTNAIKTTFGSAKTRKIWTNVWYNHDIVCATIDKVVIEYMDGEKATIKDTDKLMTREGLCRAYK